MTLAVDTLAEEALPTASDTPEILVSAETQAGKPEKAPAKKATKRSKTLELTPHRHRYRRRRMERGTKAGQQLPGA